MTGFRDGAGNQDEGLGGPVTRARIVSCKVSRGTLGADAA